MDGTNLAVLTRSHQAIAKKKRAKRAQVKEILFDESARLCVCIRKPCLHFSYLLSVRDYLTGFHKRKLQKKEESKKRREEREKQERQELRREVRVLIPFGHSAPMLKKRIFICVDLSLSISTAKHLQNAQHRTLKKSRRHMGLLSQVGQVFSSSSLQ
jgi:hypothetical protein